jgi:hypothetical protein
MTQLKLTVLYSWHEVYSTAVLSANLNTTSPGVPNRTKAPTHPLTPLPSHHL